MQKLMSFRHNSNSFDMDFFKKIIGQDGADEVQIVGSGADSLVGQQGLKFPQLAYFSTMLLLLGLMVFTFSSTSSLLQSWQTSYRQDQEALLAALQEEKNLQALQGLSEKKTEIEQQLGVIERAVPIDPRYDKVIASLEQLASASGIAVPQSISWSLVPSSEISNKDLQALEVTSYSMEVIGEYEKLLIFLKALRVQQRLMDVRSIGDLQKDPRGLMRAVIVLWTYHNL
jgi:Tfp pilus assembly protein PilO